MHNLSLTKLYIVSGKIADYGLHYLKEKCKNMDYQLSAGELLWTSPEILRCGTSYSREGDVYSFGIITQEIVLTGPPYCCNRPQLDSEEIVRRVKNGDTPPYRPSLETDGTFWSIDRLSC